MRVADIFEDDEDDDDVPDRRIFAPVKPTAQVDEVANAITQIQSECSDILGLMRRLNSNSRGNPYLYRGIDGKPPIYRAASRINRRPNDTPHLIQEVIDTWLERHGFEALRQNSIFCATSLSQAQGYGDLYAIFPVNGFKYTWYENAHDIFMVVKRQLMANEFGRVMAPHASFYDQPALIRAVNKMMQYVKPIKSHIANYLDDRGGEIQISGAYWAVSYEAMRTHGVIDKLFGPPAKG